MTPAFTTKCLVRTCSPNKHGLRRPVKTVAVAKVNVSSGDGRFVERLASFTAVDWQLEHKPVVVRCRSRWLRPNAAIPGRSDLTRISTFERRVLTGLGTFAR